MILQVISLLALLTLVIGIGVNQTEGFGPLYTSSILQVVETLTLDAGESGVLEGGSLVLLAKLYLRETLLSVRSVNESALAFQALILGLRIGRTLGNGVVESLSASLVVSQVIGCIALNAGGH